MCALVYRKRNKYHQNMADDEVRKFTHEARRRPVGDKVHSSVAFSCCVNVVSVYYTVVYITEMCVCCVEWSE